MRFDLGYLLAVAAGPTTVQKPRSPGALRQVHPLGSLGQGADAEQMPRQALVACGTLFNCKADTAAAEKTIATMTARNIFLSILRLLFLVAGDYMPFWFLNGASFSHRPGRWHETF